MTFKSNQLIIEQAMHIADGLTTTVGNQTFDGVLKIWGRGCLNLFSFASQFAETAASLLEPKLDKLEQLDGIFEYEVSCTFGLWLAKYIFENKNTPSLEVCNQELNDLASKFFYK